MPKKNTRVISFYVPDKWFKEFWKPFLKTLPRKNRNVSDAIRALVESSKGKKK